MRHPISLLLFLLIAQWSLLAQTTAIQGTVVTTKGEPLIGATVLIEGSYDGTISGEDGSFSFKTQELGEKTLLIKFIGHDDKRVSIMLDGSPIQLQIQLKEAFNELNAVTITAGSFEAGDKKKTVQLNSIDMITIPGAQGDIAGALQYTPGTTTNGESGRLFVRGGSSNESQIYIDGGLVHAPYNSSAPNTAVRSRFNPFMFQGTIFSTGGYSAEYGQALSSVLLLETNGIQEQDQLDLSFMSVGLGIAGTKKWEKGAITASFDHTNLGPYMAIFPQNIDWLKKPISNDGAINFRQKTKNGLFKLYTAYSDSRLKLAQADIDNNNITRDYDLTNRNLYLNSSWKGCLGKNWIGVVSGSLTRNTVDVGIDTDAYSEHLYGGHVKGVLKRSFGKQVKLKAGAEAQLKDYTQTFVTMTDSFPFSFQDITYAAFTEGNIHLSKKLAARIGGRFEYSSLLNKFNFSPRISLAYQTGKNSQVSAAYGTFFQNPDDAFLIYTNEIDFEQSTQYMLNFQWSKKGRTFRSEAYYKSYSSLTKFTSQPFYSPDHYTNNGNGWAYGLDFFWRDKKTIPRGDYWVSYSFLDSRRDHLNYPHEATPGFVSKHNLSVVYKHWFPKMRSMLGGAFTYSSPRLYNDPNDATFNTARMKAYHSLNLNWTYLHRENVIFYLSATNVLGYQQEFGYEFASEPNSEGVYESSAIRPAQNRFFILGCFITLSKSGTKNQLDKLE